MILGLETSCDETAAALVTDGGRDPRRTSSPRRPTYTPATAASCPRSPYRRHLELVVPVVREALGEAGATLDDVDSDRRHAGPGARRRALSSGSPRRRPSPGRAACRWAAVDHLARPRRIPLPRTRPGRAAIPLPARERRAYAPARRPGSRRLHSFSATSIDDAAGEAFDKGARLLGLGYPGGREDRPTGPVRAIPPLSRSPSRAWTGSTSRSRVSRRRSSTPCAISAARRRSGRPIWRRRAACDRSALVERTRAAAERKGHEEIAVVGGVTSNSELRESLPALASRGSSSAPTKRR